ncbi:MAG: flagellar assembly protein FliW [Myxococcales bacterium]|mgnify:CR=1 FL=1|nr:flagellar assembly protein FliW [Myxococcales bacterium]|tara:strand:- start:1948 stop:2454 length:507 start_codon:yes stop_codon:yes gene_type:complete
MIVNTTRFGQLTIDEEKVINFPFGIPGFPELQEWCILTPDGQLGVSWLQAVKDPDVALLVADPDSLFPEYNAEIDERDLGPIGVSISADSPEVPDLVMRVVLTVDRNNSVVTANLRAPIVFNIGTRQAIQVALRRGDYSVRETLAQPTELGTGNTTDGMEQLSVATGT